MTEAETRLADQGARARRAIAAQRRRDSFKAQTTVHPHPRREFSRGLFFSIYGSVAAFWIVVAIATLNHWPAIGATVAGWFA